MDSDVKDMLEQLMRCFYLRDGWYYHKTNDAEWVPVSEDLQEHLTELHERLG